MALLQKWRDKAYSETAEKSQLEKLWSDYFLKEKEMMGMCLRMLFIFNFYYQNVHKS